MFDRHQLPNGLTLIGERLPFYRSVSVGVWIGAGSQYEDDGQAGVTHFLEHMLFKGTQRRSARQIAEEMDAVGGHLNAFTAKECTCFYARTMDEHAELAMDMLSDMILCAAFDPQELEKEKGVVLEEIAMVEDEPEDLVGELIMRARFGDQPLARPILGSMDSVRAFDRAGVIAYRDRMYCPECAVLAIAGNYDWPQVIALAERYFGDWARGAGECARVATAQAPPQLLRREKEIEQLHISVAFPGYPMGGDEVYPLSIFNSALGGAMSSRLFQHIREERGMAYSVYSYPAFYTDTGMLGIYAGTGPANAAEVVKLIRAEIDELLANGITRREFEQTRTQMKGNYVLGLESASARMNALGRRMLLMRNTQTEDEALAKIDAVTFEQVNALIQRTLSQPCAAALVGNGAEQLDMSVFI